jgi:hypothetical protein
MLFHPFEAALDEFIRQAPPGGYTPRVIRAGHRECEALRQWHRTLPAAVGAAPKPPAPTMEYAGLPIEQVGEDSHLSVLGDAPGTGRLFEWPPPE